MQSPTKPIPLSEHCDGRGSNEQSAVLEQRVMPAFAPERRPPAALGTILAVGTGVGVGASVEAGTAMSELTGGRPVVRRVSDRRTGRAILAMAKEEAADLVVVDARVHRSADLAQLVRPSLDAGFSVLAIPPTARTARRVERIGVGHDGSPAAQRALATAVDLVRVAGDAVAYLDVIYVDEAPLPSDELDAHELTSSRDSMIEWWLAALSDEVPALVRPGRLVGDPVRALADLSLDLDLLIVGMRRRGRVRRLLDPGVSAGLLVRARCPLLIVPPCGPRDGHRGDGLRAG